MFEGQQRDMRLGVILDLCSVLFQIVHDVSNFEGVPIQDRIGDQAQTAGLVHDFFVITRREFPPWSAKKIRRGSL